MSVWTERSAVNGGQITTSTRSASFRSKRYESFCTVWIASRCVLCIFQFAAMIGVRSATSVLQHPDARQRFPLEELERGPAAGGQVIERALQAGALDGEERVAATDDRERGGAGDRGSHAARAGREGLELEDAHRAVPQD